MSTKPKETTTKAPECQCGCGDTTKGGRYAPGHDARHKRDLIEAALAGSKRAVNKLETLGWLKFLDAKREKLGTEKPKSEAVEESTAALQEEQPQKAVAAAPRRRGRPRKQQGEEAPAAEPASGADAGTEEAASGTDGN
jgi:hypothetical protein